MEEEPPQAKAAAALPKHPIPNWLCTGVHTAMLIATIRMQGNALMDRKAHLDTIANEQ